MDRDYLLKPGYIYLPSQPVAISTVLGSSVSVTLWDRGRPRGGMNHFLYPFLEQGQKATARFGDVAVMTLVRMMLRDGSPRENLEAQIFGGAYNPRVSTRDLGRENVAWARRILRKEGIRVVSEDVGGQLGRKVIYKTDSCEMVVLKVDRLRDSDWFPYTPGSR